MHKLIQLELKRNHISTYVIASLIICACTVGFIYLFAALPYLDNDIDLVMFSTYGNITTLVCALEMLVFSILSSAMYNRFVIEEYGGKRAALLFSYPVKRSKVFASKVIIVFSLTVFAMVVCSFISFSIFYLTESISPIVNDMLSIKIVLNTISTAFVFSIIAGAFGIISMRIGFIKRSFTVTIISSVVLSTVLCNIVANISQSYIFTMMFLIASVFIGVILIINLMLIINHLDVE